MSKKSLSLRINVKMSDCVCERKISPRKKKIILVKHGLFSSHRDFSSRWTRDDASRQNISLHLYPSMDLLTDVSCFLLLFNGNNNTNFFHSSPSLFALWVYMLKVPDSFANLLRHHAEQLTNNHLLKGNTLKLGITKKARYCWVLKIDINMEEIYLS